MKRELTLNLAQIKERAQQRRDEFEVMAYMLEANEEISDAELDALVEKVAAPIIAAVDCTQCANCCRSLNVYLTQADAQQLAQGVNIPLDAVMTRYIDHEAAQQVGEWGRFRQIPCVFLEGNRCSVYAHRPETCRLYPVFTPDFRWTLDDIIEGAELCPIIYNVLDVMVEVTEKL